MEINIDALVKRWAANAKMDVKSQDKIQEQLESKQISLPEEFKALYLRVNGMLDQDEEGFRFYSLDELIKTEDKFKINQANKLQGIILFVDYMIDSWWYGIKLNGNGSYVVGIVPSAEQFTPITTSLSEFIKLYLQNSEILYKY